MCRYSNNVKEIQEIHVLCDQGLKITGKTWIHLEKINNIIEKKNDTLPFYGRQCLDTKLKSHAVLDTQQNSPPTK